MTVREIVFITLFHKTPASQVKNISAADQGLFMELTQGVRREDRYLEFILNNYSKKKPRPKNLLLLKIAAYQMLFLNSVPEYAIFSTTKELAKTQNVSEEEGAFIHGVLKSLSKDLEKHKKERLQFFEEAEKGFQGQKVPNPELLSIMFNLDPEVITEVVDTAKKVFGSSTNAWKALAFLKVRPQLVGFLLGDGPLSEAVKSLESELAPHGVVFTSEVLQKLLSEKKAWVQGEGSQWACQWVTELLMEQRKAQTPVRVLEMTAGKGGKTLGTVACLKRQKAETLKDLEWLASDSSMEQMDLFAKNVYPLLKEYGLDFETAVWDWTRDEPLDGKGKKFNLVWLDAPCSGIGTLSKHPEIGQRLTRVFISEAAEKQRHLLEKAVSEVSPSGILFYSVCTLTYSETLAQVQWFTEKFPRFRLLKHDFVWPGVTGKTNDGFFAMAFQYQE